jgi:hypothetical protein
MGGLMRKLAIGLVVAAVFSVSPSAFASVQLVPSYFYPTGTPNPWTVMCSDMSKADSGSIAIMNPANGPGHKADPNYAAALADCHLDGQRVIGYVATRYTRTSIEKLEEDVDAYFSFYPTIDGIFLDNMAQDPTSKASCKGCTMTVESYYSTLYNYVHSKATNVTVVGNPGAPATTSWQLSAPVADAVVTFEGSSASYQTYAPPLWVLEEPANKIANLVYAAPATVLASDCSTAADDNAGLLYVTDLNLKPNPYDALPSYWTTETATC